MFLDIGSVQRVPSVRSPWNQPPPNRRNGSAALAPHYHNPGQLPPFRGKSAQVIVAQKAKQRANVNFGDGCAKNRGPPMPNWKGHSVPGAKRMDVRDLVRRK